MTPIPNHYTVLSLINHPDLSYENIRMAFKKAALLTHPDQFYDASESERFRAKENFQRVIEAYNVLRDPTRKKEYDLLLRNQEEFNFNSEYESSHNPFNNPIQFFQSILFCSRDSLPTNNSSQLVQNEDKTKLELDDILTSLTSFCETASTLTPLVGILVEDLLKEEKEDENSTSSTWKYLGMISGGTLGYITGNIRGMGMGAVVGNQLGVIRDNKNKSVHQVLTELLPNQKKKFIENLAVNALSYLKSKKNSNQHMNE